MTLKFEFLVDGSTDTPLVRIFAGSPEEFGRLHLALTKLSTAEITSIVLTDLPGAHPIDDLRLTAERASANEGVTISFTPRALIWRLRPEEWDTVCGLLEPFLATASRGGHQWLTGPEARYGLDVGKISVLVSDTKDGNW